jgi:hypothetical protein
MKVDQKFLDVTMLARDMGVHEIPEDHPDSEVTIAVSLSGNQVARARRYN